MGSKCLYEGRAKTSWLLWSTFIEGKLLRLKCCNICLRILESTGHILWGCESTIDIWCQGCRKTQKLLLISDLFLDIWLKLQIVLSKEELEEVAYTLKFIWQRMNDFIFQNKFIHPNTIILKIKSKFQCYRNYMPQLHTRA